MSSARITVVGFVRRSEMKYLPSGMAVLEFSIPIDRKWKDKNSGEVKEKTSWINLKAFGKTAENIEKFFPVGKGGIFFGDLETEEWEGEGGKRSKTVINVQSFDFPPVSKSESESYQQAPQQNRPTQKAASNQDQQSRPIDDFEDQDIPF